VQEIRGTRDDGLFHATAVSCRRVLGNHIVDPEKGGPGGGLGVAAARGRVASGADDALEKASEGETAACDAGVDQEARREEGHQVRHSGLIIAHCCHLTNR
jgi:hypothetical protein